MAIPARLARVLHQRLGDEGGDDLVNWMTSMDANRSELRDLMDAWNGRTDARFAEVGARVDGGFAAADARIEGRFAESEARIDGRFAEMEARIDGRFTEMDARIDGRFTAADARTTGRFAEEREFMVSTLTGMERRLDTRITDLYKWMFVFWCGGTLALILAVLLK